MPATTRRDWTKAVRTRICMISAHYNSESDKCGIPERTALVPKILIVTGDGGEAYETWLAVHRFQEAGYETRIAAPSKRRLHLVMHDFEPGWDTYKEGPGYAIESDLTFDEVKVAEYDAVLCIGGRAPE